MFEAQIVLVSGHLGVYPESAAVLEQYLPMTIIAFPLPAHPKYPSIAAQNYQPFYFQRSRPVSPDVYRMVYYIHQTMNKVVGVKQGRHDQ